MRPNRGIINAPTAPQDPAHSPASNPAWLEGNSRDTYDTASTTSPAHENISSHITPSTRAPLPSESAKNIGKPTSVAANTSPRYRGPVRSRIAPHTKYPASHAEGGIHNTFPSNA